MTREDQEPHAKQEFNKPVGQAIQADQVQIDDQSVSIAKVSGDVAGRDIVNVHAARSRRLTKDERRTLNRYVSRLDQEFGQSGAQTWSSIHRILGVNSIEDIHLEQYNPTEAILQQLFEIAQLRSSLANRGDGADESVPIVQEALTTLTERNGRLVTELDQQRRAYGELEQRFKKQADAMQSLRASTATAEGKANRWMDSLLKAADRVEELQKEIANQETRVANLTASLAVAEERAGSAKLNFRAIAVALFFATACGAVLWYKAHSSEKALAQLQSQSKQCMFAGKPYAIGSIIDNPSAPDVECVLSEHGKSPEWRTIKQTRTNRR